MRVGSPACGTRFHSHAQTASRRRKDDIVAIVEIYLQPGPVAKFELPMLECV
jgi:hypothetical protein